MQVTKYLLPKRSERLKIGFDLHGVINEYPKFFARLSRALVRDGNEVHIITGNKRTKEFQREIDSYGFQYTHFFSITEFHEKKKTKIRWVKNHPFMDEYQWDRTKGDYCRKHQIDMHIDDTDAYKYFFSTPFCRFFSMNKRKHYKPEEVLTHEDREILETVKNNPGLLRQLQGKNA
jgi:hypothetical protein